MIYKYFVYIFFATFNDDFPFLLPKYLFKKVSLFFLLLLKFEKKL